MYLLARLLNIFVVAARHGRTVGIPASYLEGLWIHIWAPRRLHTGCLQPQQTSLEWHLKTRKDRFLPHTFHVTFRTIIQPHDTKVEQVHLQHVLC
jgi:hypothetical protein